MIEEVVLATRNEGKVGEFAHLLTGVFGRIISLNDIDGAPDVVEDGKTFRENALKKARAISSYTGKPALADDSGLEVDSLGGGPGVYSARYSGENATDKSNYEKLLTELGGASNRSARFVCCLALVEPGGRETVVTGTCEGIITLAPGGEGGFGYDPVFYVPKFGKTMAQLSPSVKNNISHRAEAARELRRYLGEAAR